jgi:Bacteriophage HK97-gp10, putative tail-component
MAKQAQVRVLGYDELARGSKELASNIDRAAKKELERVAEDAAGSVRGQVPRRTGRLAGTVSAQPAGDAVSLSMGAGVPYARFVEYGGRGHPHSAQGNYLYPAAEESRPLAEQAALEVAESEIGRMRWPTPT